MISISRAKSIIESLIFASESPVTLAEMKAAIQEADSQVTEDDSRLIGQAVKELAAEYANADRPLGRGFKIEEVAGGFQFRTVQENAEYVRCLLKAKPSRMSRAAIETLAIIAYRQPITRPEVEQVRGVDSGQVVKTLLEKRFVKILGRKDEPGRPIIYGTTEEFLLFFGLKSLGSLPSLKEFKDLSEVHPTIKEEAKKSVADKGILDGLDVLRESFEKAMSGEAEKEAGETIEELEAAVRETADLTRKSDKTLAEHQAVQAAEAGEGAPVEQQGAAPAAGETAGGAGDAGVPGAGGGTDDKGGGGGGAADA